jgi:hypothetical protein
MKVEPKNLEAFLGVVKILEMSIKLMRSSIVANHRTMKGQHVCSRMELGI